MLELPWGYSFTIRVINLIDLQSILPINHIMIHDLCNHNIYIYLIAEFVRYVTFERFIVASVLRFKRPIHWLASSSGDQSFWAISWLQALGLMIKSCQLVKVVSGGRVRLQKFNFGITTTFSNWIISLLWSRVRPFLVLILFDYSFKGHTLVAAACLLLLACLLLACLLLAAAAPCCCLPAACLLLACCLLACCFH